MTDPDDPTNTRDATTDIPALRVAPLLEALGRHDVEYVVIGGIAAQLHGDGHPTRGLDITLSPYGPNLDRLRTALADVDAREYVPGFGYPLQLDMSRRRLSADAPLRTVTRHGSLDVIPRPHGIDSYSRLYRGKRYRSAYGVSVPFADLADLIHSHTAAARPKDGPILDRLTKLQARIHWHGLQPVYEQPAPDTRAGTDHESPPVGDERRIHAALDAASTLATVFDDIRPALGAARRQLQHAIDDVQYGNHATGAQRIRIANIAITAAHTELVALRRKLQPAATDVDLAEPPQRLGARGGATLLAYQAYEEVSVTRRILTDLEPAQLIRPEARDMLIEARIHAATAEWHLELLQLQLERTARAWEIPEHGRDLPGPEL